MGVSGLGNASSGFCLERLIAVTEKIEMTIAATIMTAASTRYNGVGEGVGDIVAVGARVGVGVAVVAGTVVAVGVGVVDGVVVGGVVVRAGAGGDVAVGVGDGVGAGVGVAVGEGDGVGVGVGVGVGANVAEMVCDASTLLKVYDDATVTGEPSTVKDAME